jgi:hypothetical protein
VLVKAVKDGVGRLDAPIAYATGKSEEGYHTGVIQRELGQVYFDDKSLLVHPDHVVRRDVEICPKCGKPVPECICEQPPELCPKCGKPVDECICEEPVKKVRRYYGRVAIDPQRGNKDMALIVAEVVERLTSQIGCEVDITVEINAKKPDGFEESTVRTVSENSRTLKFEHFGFEEE